MAATEDLVQWCSHERAKLYDELEDREAAEKYAQDRSDGAAPIDPDVPRIDRVKKRIANLDRIIKRIKN